MSRYIDAEPYKDMCIGKVFGVMIKAGKNFAPNDVYGEDFVKVANVNDIPTADVQEVKHGKWIICGAFDDMMKCSECEKRNTARMRPITYRGLPKWCEDCGAKMDLRG